MNGSCRSLIIIGLCVIIALSSSQTVMAFEAEDLAFGFGQEGWQTGLGLSQENVRRLGLFGFERTGIGGFLSHPGGDDPPSSWFSGHRQVTIGNIDYRLELFVANTMRPILSTFMTSSNPHVGAYGEFSRMYGDIGHGLAGTAQLFVSELGEFEYNISPYIQLTRQGVWRFSLSLGSSFGIGMSYLEPGEKVQLDVTLVNEGLSFHVLLSMSELPVTLGAGVTQEQTQVFVRYSF